MLKLGRAISFLRNVEQWGCDLSFAKCWYLCSVLQNCDLLPRSTDLASFSGNVAPSFWADHAIDRVVAFLGNVFGIGSRVSTESFSGKCVVFADQLNFGKCCSLSTYLVLRAKCVDRWKALSNSFARRVNFARGNGIRFSVLKFSGWICWECFVSAPLSLKAARLHHDNPFKKLQAACGASLIH